MLINAPRTATPADHLGVPDYRMPLGILYIAAYLRQRGIPVSVLDAEALGYGIGEIVRYALDLRPKLVGINCHTLNRKVVYTLVDVIKAVMQDAVVVMGGAHPSLAPVETLRECGTCDAVVIGEGEHVMDCIWRNLGDWRGIPGIAYVAHGECVVNEAMPQLVDLDSLPFPDPADVPFARYAAFEDQALPGMWHRAYLSVSRGCRYRCSFCVEPAIWRGTTRFRSSANVQAEISQYSRNFGIERFYFYDDTFTDWPELAEFCLFGEEMKIEWSCSTRIDQMNDNLVELMGRGGCREIAFGLESGSERILKRIHKGWQQRVAKSEIGATIRNCLQHGIVPRAHFIIGFPWEAERDITESVMFAVQLKEYGLADVNFFAAKVYPGSEHYGAEMRARRDAADIQGIKLYDMWSIPDWQRSSQPKVAAKLRRFNDLPYISLHPRFDCLSIRQIITNAYEVFFGPYGPEEVSERLWQGIRSERNHESKDQ